MSKIKLRAKLDSQFEKVTKYIILFRKFNYQKVGLKNSFCISCVLKQLFETVKFLCGNNVCFYKLLILVMELKTNKFQFTVAIDDSLKDQLYTCKLILKVSQKNIQDN